MKGMDYFTLREQRLSWVAVIVFMSLFGGGGVLKHDVKINAYASPVPGAGVLINDTSEIFYVSPKEAQRYKLGEELMYGGVLMMALTLTAFARVRARRVKAAGLDLSGMGKLP